MKITLLLLITTLIRTTLIAQAGSLDTTFDRDGKQITDFRNTADAYAVALQKSGKIVVAGRVTKNGLNYDFVLTRYRLNGTLDQSFGVNGIVKTNFGYTFEFAYGVAIQPDDKIIAVGSGDGSVALTRYQTDGIPDSSFGVNGKTITPFDSTFSMATSVVLQPDGKIVVAAAAGAPYDFVVIRYNSNGSLDSSFGINGKTITKLTEDQDLPCSVLLQKDGKIILAGNAASDFALVRYQQNGKLDKSFGINGIAINGRGHNGSAGAAALQADGKILLLGTKANDSTQYGIIVRYKPDGSIDTSFNHTGRRVIRPRYWQGYNALAIQPDDKILLAGTVDNGATYQDFIINRLNPDGTFDKTFGTGGMVTTDFKTRHTNEAINAIVIQPDGKIVAVGVFAKGGGVYTCFAIARYNGSNGLAAGRNIFSDSKTQDITHSTVRIFPNPVKDVLQVTGLSASLKTISVFDLKGNLLQQVTTTGTSYPFNTKQLSAGMYLIKIEQNNGFKTLNFMKE